MTINPNEWTQYEVVRDRHLNGNASDHDIAELERFVLSDDACKRDFAEHSQLAAALNWNDNPSWNAEPTSVSAPPAGDQWSPRRLVGFVTAIAAAGLVVVFGWTAFGPASPTASFASLVSTDGCQWTSSTLPTTPGQKLSAGRLQLQSGIAKFRFPNVNVSLEGPADFEIVDARHCILHFGRVCADVENGGEGFTVQTPNAELIDRGTRFGVSVDEAGDSSLQVFDGRVDVQHRETGEAISVTTDQGVDLLKSSIVPSRPGEPAATDRQDAAIRSSSRRVQISTAVGRGDDHYVSRGELPEASSSVELLLVKLAPKNDWANEWNREAVLKFDLSLLGGSKIKAAKLQLTGAASNIGFASLLPDATFAIYAITDEAIDSWKTESLTWDRSPARQLSERSGETQPLIMDKGPRPILVGKFTVPQSNPAGTFIVESDELAQFLREDTNGLATFALVAETSGEGACYVHGFASKRHRSLPAPTLRIELDD